MKTFLKKLPVLLIALVEGAVGAMLFVDEAIMSTMMVIVSAIALMVFGVIHLINYMKIRETEKSGALTLTMAVFLLLVGIAAAVFNGQITDFFTAQSSKNLMYGIMLAVFGIYLFGLYFDLEKQKVRLSLVAIITSIMSLILGVMLVFFKTDTVTVTAVILICIAVFNLLSFFLKVKDEDEKDGKKEEQKPFEEKKDETED